MLHRVIVGATAFAASISLVPGCAGVRSLESDHAAAAIAPAGDLSGTWYGSFGQVGAALYVDEYNSVLRVNPDETFTATLTRGLGTNNLAKPATWVGTVTMRANRVTLRNTEGSWPWITLTRSGDDVLYGLAVDPAIEAPVMIRFERPSR